MTTAHIFLLCGFCHLVVMGLCVMAHRRVHGYCLRNQACSLLMGEKWVADRLKEWQRAQNSYVFMAVGNLVFVVYYAIRLIV